MAVKQVVTDGVGFNPPAYLLTEGIGDFPEASGDPSDGLADPAVRRRRARAVLMMLFGKGE